MEITEQRSSVIGEIVNGNVEEICIQKIISTLIMNVYFLREFCAECKIFIQNKVQDCHAQTKFICTYCHNFENFKNKTIKFYNEVWKANLQPIVREKKLVILDCFSGISTRKLTRAWPSFFY